MEKLLKKPKKIVSKQSSKIGKIFKKDTPGHCENESHPGHGEVAAEFIRNIIKVFEAKLEEYEKIADVRGEPKSITLMGQKLPEGGLGPFYAAGQKGYQIVAGKIHRKRAKKVANIFQELPKEKRREIFAETGAAIYYSFQDQLNQATDIEGNWRRGWKKVAEDAGDRAFRYLGEQSGRAIDISCRTLTKAVISGLSNSLEGHTIKLSRTGNDLKTDDLFGVQGLKTLTSNGEIEFYIRKDSDGTVPKLSYEYRFTFDWDEEYDWLQVFPNIRNYGTQMAACDGINKRVLEEIVPQVLEELLENDSLNLQKVTLSKVDHIEDGVDKATAVVDCIRENVHQISSGVNRIDEGVTQTASGVGRIEGRVAQIASEVDFMKKDINQFRILSNKREDQNKTPLTKFRFNFIEPVAHFSGRSRELETLHQLLSKNAQHVVLTQSAAIRGLGGIGKTELARMYASMYATEFYDGNIIWIDSETDVSRKESFEKLAKKLEITLLQQIEHQEKPIDTELVEEVFERLSNSKYLIIFDNAEKYEDIKQFLFQSSTNKIIRPTILITSRSNNWTVEEEGFIEPLPLDVFKKEEALSFIKKKWKITETETFWDEKICELNELLSRFPLALRAAVGYLNSSRIKVTKENILERIDEYIALYQTNTNKCLNYSSSLDRYGKTMYNTWRITFDRIKMNEEYGEDALDLMEKIAYCRPDAINFYVGMNLEQRKVKRETRKREEVWMILSEYSLISIDEKTFFKKKPKNIPKFASVHRLVQEVVRLWLREEDREETVLRNFLNIIDEKERFGPEGIWNYASKYSSLIDEFALNYIMFDSIRRLISCRNYQSLDSILDRMEKLEAMSWKVDWEMMLLINGISDYMIKGSEDFDELARNLCIFFAYFERNLDSADSMKTLNNFLKNFSKRFDKKILLETWYFSNFPILHMTARKGDKKLVQWLLNNGANPKSLDRYGETAIHHAVQGRYHDIGDVMRLLAINAEELNGRNQRGKTPLHLAAQKGNLNAVKYLLEIGADPTIADNEGRNAIHLAVKRRNLELLKLLSLNEETCNFATKNGETSLHIALGDNNDNDYLLWKLPRDAKPTVEFLLGKGADPLICDNEGRNSIWYALRHRHTEVIRLFIKRGLLTSSTRFEDGQSPLHIATASGDIELVKMLLQMGLEINCADNYGTQPLHLAFHCYKGRKFNHIEIIKLLVEKGANKNCEDNDGVKLIHLASKNGDLSIMKLCAESDSDYESKTKSGKSPLHYAAGAGELNVVKFLLDEGKVSPNTRDNEDMTPVARALAEGCQIIVELFLERGLFDVNVKLPNNRYPLQLALDSGDYNLVRFLIDRGANSRLVGEGGVKAVHLAAKAGDVDFLRRFADDGSELGSRTADGRTPLHFAALRAQKDAIEFLLEGAIDPNVIDNYGLPAIAYTIFDIEDNRFKSLTNRTRVALNTPFNSRIETIGDISFKSFLNCARVNLNAPFNAIGITPLIHTLLQKRKNIVKLLLNSKRFSVDAVGYESTLLGKLQISALHVAAYVGKYDAVEILTEAYKMDVNSGLDVSWTPLQAAASHYRVTSFLTRRSAKIADDNSSVYRDVIQDFLKDPQNQKLVDAYARTSTYFNGFDTERIRNFVITFS